MWSWEKVLENLWSLLYPWYGDIKYQALLLFGKYDGKKQLSHKVLFFLQKTSPYS